MDAKHWPASVALPGVVSEGTLRPLDLIPAFRDVLRALNPAQHFWLLIKYSAGYERDDEVASEYCMMLQDALEEAAPEGYYFGTVEGDGACFGFFEVSDDA